MREVILLRLRFYVSAGPLVQSRLHIRQREVRVVLPALFHTPPVKRDYLAVIAHSLLQVFGENFPSFLPHPREGHGGAVENPWAKGDSRQTVAMNKWT